MPILVEFRIPVPVAGPFAIGSRFTTATLLEHSSKGDEGVESISRHMFDNTNGAWGTSPITRSVVPRTAGMYSLQRFHFPGRIPAFARGFLPSSALFIVGA